MTPTTNITDRLRRLTRLAMILAMLLPLAAVAGCGGEPDAAQAPPPAEPEPEPGAARTVVAVEAIQPVEQFEDIISLPGVTEPIRVVNVASEVAGRVEAVAVEEGQSVSCAGDGSVLVRLNTDLLQADYDRNKSEAEFNRRDYERLEDAYRKGVATQTEVDQARMRMESYEALMASSAAQLERSTIMAPIDGLVNDLPVEEGEYLQPGTPVAQIIDLSVVKVLVDIPERDVAFLTIGDQVTVAASHRGKQQSFPGTVTFISQLADPNTFTSRAEITVPNPERLLRTGQIVNVEITRRIIDDAVIVPLLAVIPRENDHIVYVAEDIRIRRTIVPREYVIPQLQLIPDRYLGMSDTIDELQSRRRVVELGLIRGQTVQIVSGLAGGDRLIIAGQRYVSHKQAIRIEPTVAEKLEAELAADGSPPDGDQP